MPCQVFGRPPGTRALRRGLTFTEITIAVLIVATLAATAWVNYRSFTVEGRIISADKDLRVIQEALKIYTEDHPFQEFPSHSAEGLRGRYLGSLNFDPWGGDYIVDPFFGRVISRGPDGILDTPVPGHDEDPAASSSVPPDGGDDRTRQYLPQGTIALLDGGGPELRAFTPEGLSRVLSLGDDIAGFDLGYDRGTAAVSRASNVIELLQDVGGSEPSLLASTAATAAVDVAFSPKGLRVATVPTDRGSLWVTGIDVPSANLYNKPPQAVIPQGSGLTLSRPSWNNLGTELVVATGDGSILRLEAVAGSRATTLVEPGGAYAEVTRNGPAWSPDGKRIAFPRNETTLAIVSAVTGLPVQEDIAGFGTIRGLTWSPDGTKLAVLSGTDIVLVAVLNPGDRRAPREPRTLDTLRTYKFTPEPTLGGGRAITWR